jgi:hypothetical protein
VNEIIYCQDCHKPTRRTCPTTKRCRTCQDIADKERKSKWKEKADRDIGGYYGKPTKCLCPMCGKEFIRRLDWTGRGKPRVYCSNCREFIESGYFPEPHVLRFEARV